MNRQNDVTVPPEQFAGQVKWDAQGLAPAIVQDAQSKEVLTLAYMNEESLRMTLQLGQAVYYSRSRKTLWHKGATSGEFQEVVEIRTDCDQDAIVLVVNQTGRGAHSAIAAM